MVANVKCSVIPAAGKGSRMYPLTKSVPKELLPLVGQPVLLTVIEEAQRCGIEQFHLITSPQKPALREFFTPSEDDNPSHPRAFTMPQVDFVTQEVAKGLGHAVLQSRDIVGNQPFVVQLPDDLYHPEDPLLQAMLDVHTVTGGCVVALMEVTTEEAKMYSSATVETADLSDKVTGGHVVFKLSNIIEKPNPEQVRSNYALMGRYVLDSRIFEILAQTPPGRNNEIQLTDALAAFAEIPVTEGGGVWGVVSRGRHFDTGNLAGYVQAQIELSLEDEYVGKTMRKFIQGLADKISVNEDTQAGE
ncbi:UTP--glucose-1-phosphate uridylyltransferase [uncultured Mobiluncus sp.]|uniref:UTP--glucose-1-phosphate uridylyltransferase n=1 Tax=uncultured Mobiluncus sp. TaxID=293425 RepID=UPI00260EB4EB|nr:sugar phosphate nucleotidyltransferase [uncultured Mobiluncus sp.]